MRSSLESKTIRPGLTAYSFYRSDRRPLERTPLKASKKPKLAGKFAVRLITFLIVAAAAVGGYRLAIAPSGKPSDTSKAPVITAVQTGTAAKACKGAPAGKEILVSISQRHLWACQDQSQVYDTPVITGIELYASTATPPGTYKIYAKQTNTTLNGSDQAGSWSDPVSYWMPFLDNQYGEYGLHDATWRAGDPFGKIDPNSADASHGCVELPLGAAGWLYGWAPIGTTVTIEA